MSRGIISIYWGDESKLPIERLKASVKKFHPELPHEIIKVEAPGGEASSLNQKSAMLDLSPFDETLFLDLDTVVMGRLDFGFEKAVTFGMALAICEAPWGKRYPKIFVGDEIEYNTGVIFFTKKAKPVFDTWKDLAGTIDSGIIAVGDQGIYTMPANDQLGTRVSIQCQRMIKALLLWRWSKRDLILLFCP